MAAIEGLKSLIQEAHMLAVPDEAAAIAAANAWLGGHPATGRPYELGADTSGYAIGGVTGQCAKDNGRLAILLYFSAHLSPSQQNWHPFEQAFWGLLQLRRETVNHFGRIPPATHTDHGTITRLAYLPRQRIEATHYRWVR